MPAWFHRRVGKWTPSDDLIFLDGSEVASDRTGEKETSTMREGDDAVNLGETISGNGSQRRSAR